MLKITHTEENNRKFFSKKVLHLLNVKLNILFRCGPSPEPCPAVPVLPDPDRSSNEQMFPSQCPHTSAACLCHLRQKVHIKYGSSNTLGIPAAMVGAGHRHAQSVSNTASLRGEMLCFEISCTGSHRGNIQQHSVHTR